MGKCGTSNAMNQKESDMLRFTGNHKKLPQIGEDEHEL